MDDRDCDDIPASARCQKEHVSRHVETPKSCHNEFDCDPEPNLFLLGGLLPEGMIRSTHSRAQRRAGGRRVSHPVRRIGVVSAEQMADAKECLFPNPCRKRLQFWTNSD